MAPLFRHLTKSILLSKRYPTKRYLTISCYNLQKNVPVENVYDTRTEREKMIHKKFMELMDRYEEITGLKEVRIYQDRVIKAQDELLKIQEQRRQLNEELAKITIQRSELQNRFHSLSRDDPQWFATISEDNRLLLEERKIRSTLTNVERDERDFFTFMSNAVRDSHEKQRWQSDRTKYWSLILTIISSFLTYLISNWRHKKIVNQLIETKNNSNLNAPITSQENGELRKLITTLTDGTQQLQNVSATSAVTTKTITNLEKKIAAALQNEAEIKTSLDKINLILDNHHRETVDIISNNQHIQFLGETANTDLDSINAVHGPSFGLGILCTFGVLALLKIMFGQH